jgi:hypothetical protein
MLKLFNHRLELFGFIGIGFYLLGLSFDYVKFFKHKYFADVNDLAENL